MAHINQALAVPIIVGFLTLTAAGAHGNREDVFFRQGNQAFDRGRFAAAATAYTRALELNPRNLKVLYDRALANEMADRQAAMRDWQRFLDFTGSDPSWKTAAASARQRLQALEALPTLPETLRPGRYISKYGDYYHQVAEESAGLQWTHFPVRVFVGVSSRDWQGATREALDIWIGVFPLQLVTKRDDADIIINWAGLRKSPGGPDRLGTEEDFAHIEKEDGTVIKRRRTSYITLDLSRRWSHDLMRAAVVHELGHALGIGGHSDSARDVMYPQEGTVLVELKNFLYPTQPVTPGPSMKVPERSSVSAKLTHRDINTLIRLYNCAGVFSLLR